MALKKPLICQASQQKALVGSAATGRERAVYTPAMEFIRDFIQNLLDKIMDIGTRHMLIVRNTVFEMN